MTKSGALKKFFEGFGLDAFPSTAVPDEATFPWLTYENTIGNAGDSVAITVSLWYHTESEAVLNDKAEEIAEAIGRGGTQIPYDTGSIWIKRGSPWSVSLSDDSDNSIKRRQLNITLEYL